MLDSHFHPQDWGIRPILFEILGFEVPSYTFFVTLGLIIGIMIYLYLAKSEKKYNDNTIMIFAAAMIFGILGAKLPILISNFKYIVNDPTNIALYLSGRTVVGGLIGGTIGVVIVKRLLNIKDRRGNLIAPAAAIGIAIGRIGCLFQGCCYGKPTTLGIGMNFGDDVLRHPTQIYEIIFHTTMFIVLLILRKKENKPGKLFKLYVSSYFIFRFLTEFIRVEPKGFLNLSGYQIAALIGIILINLKEVYLKRHNMINDSI